jgi:glycosyltransferase involved in cell wall biosynthesis
MNICFICKYPPIEGGVSMHGYWSARGLAERGHKVFVVTNANEVEANFRIRLSQADLEPGGEYAKEFPETSGAVKVISTDPPDRSRLYYVPLNNPTVTRLATIATNIIRAENCKVIFAYYFEPYGLAAHLASLWTQVPYVLKHAGSDLFNLTLLEDLQTAYVEVMKGANRVISSGPSRRAVISYGVPEERIASWITFKLPKKYFNPNGPTLAINNLLAVSARESQANGFETNDAPLQKSLPVLGIYGKLGEYKGTFDLLRAMKKLLSSGFQFYLVAMCHGWRKTDFDRITRELGIEEYVRVLPFQPHWRVPEFIRSCTAVAFLERDFPIAAHGPTIPSEVITCGKCVIISEEIARKQPYRGALRNLQNIVIVPDPKQHDTLAECVRFALEDQSRAEEIGRRGLAELNVNQDHEKYIGQLETLLVNVAKELPVRNITSVERVSQNPPDAQASLVRLFTATWSLLDDERKQALVDSISLPSIEGNTQIEPNRALALGSQLLSFLDNDAEIGMDAIREVARYEYLVHECQAAKQETKTESLPRSFVLSGSRMGPLYPSLNGECRIVEFTYDVQAIVANVGKDASVPHTAVPNRIRVLFHASASPFKINEPTERLFQLLSDRALTTDEILNQLRERYGGNGESADKQLEEAFRSVMERLYWEGIIDFAESPSQTSTARASQIGAD